jgi:hypothetical protein
MSDNADPAVVAWKAKPWRQKWRQVAWYKYRSIDGIVRFAHVKWATRHPSGLDPVEKRPKTFTYRTATFAPDGSTHPRSMWPIKLDSLDDQYRHLIYMVPELMSFGTRARTLVICEGEKDARAVASLSMLATTAHGGATKWGKPETAWLEQAGWDGTIWIAIDDDNVGWLHARATLAALEDDDGVWKWPVRCLKARQGKDPHDAIVGADLGRNWWTELDPQTVIACAEVVERKLVAAGGGASGPGRVNGYLMPDVVAKWKQTQMARAMEGEDW